MNPKSSKVWFPNPLNQICVSGKTKKKPWKSSGMCAMFIPFTVWLLLFCVSCLSQHPVCRANKHLTICKRTFSCSKFQILTTWRHGASEGRENRSYWEGWSLSLHAPDYLLCKSILSVRTKVKLDNTSAPTSPIVSRSYYNTFPDLASSTQGATQWYFI